MNPANLNGIQTTEAINAMYLNSIKAKLSLLKDL
jgi:hypothetical protein